jgi:predicted solute-binding protein
MMNEQFKAMLIIDTARRLYDDAHESPLIAVQNAMNAIGYLIQSSENPGHQEMLIEFVRNYVSKVEANLGSDQMVFADLLKVDE